MPKSGLDSGLDTRIGYQDWIPIMIHKVFGINTKHHRTAYACPHHRTPCLIPAYGAGIWYWHMVPALGTDMKTRGMPKSGSLMWSAVMF